MTDDMKNRILTSKNYEDFKLLKHNRRIVEYHVQDLVRSFTDRPHLRPARPVLVNDNMEIIDGQHRVEASKRLGWDIYYMIVEGLTISDARLLNALQRTWSLFDYAESYASDGHDEYVKFLETYKIYHMPAMALIAYMSGKQAQGERTAFKTGQFKSMDDQEVNQLLGKLEDFKPYITGWNEERFALAVLTLLKHEKYDHRRMLQKLEGGVKLLRQPSRLEYLRHLEDVYNTDTRLENRIRFWGQA